MGGATGCFSESFAYQGVYCPSELSLFSRPPSWQLVRTPKVIRLHNTHTHSSAPEPAPKHFRSALSTLSLCVPENLLLFFRLLSVFRRFASPTWPTPKFSPRWVPFRRFRCSLSHTEADRNCRFNTIFPFFVPLFLLFFVAFKREPLFSSSSAENPSSCGAGNFLSLSRVTTGNGHLFHRFLNGDHLSSFTIRNIPRFEGTSKLLLLFFFSLVWPGAFSLFLLLLAFLRTHTNTHRHTDS